MISSYGKMTTRLLAAEELMTLGGFVILYKCVIPESRFIIEPDRAINCPGCSSPCDARTAVQLISESDAGATFSLPRR